MVQYSHFGWLNKAITTVKLLIFASTIVSLHSITALGCLGPLSRGFEWIELAHQSLLYSVLLLYW